MKNLAQQQDARAQAEEKLRISFEEIKKIKADFKPYKEYSETDRAALVKRADDAEGQLKLVTKELTSLKRHISKMTMAVFGKHCLMILQ